MIDDLSVEKHGDVFAANHQAQAHRSVRIIERGQMFCIIEVRRTVVAVVAEDADLFFACRPDHKPNLFVFARKSGERKFAGRGHIGKFYVEGKSVIRVRGGAVFRIECGGGTRFLRYESALFIVPCE